MRMEMQVEIDLFHSTMSAEGHPNRGSDSAAICSGDVLPDVLLGTGREFGACAIENDFSITQDQERSIGIRRGLLRLHHLALFFVEAMGRPRESTWQAIHYHTPSW